MKIIAISVAAAALLSAAPALAQDATPASPQVYGTLGYTGVFADIDEDDAHLGGLTGRIGAKLNRYVGVEGEYTFGIKDEDVRIGGTNVNVELERQYAGYVVGYVPLSPRAELFGRVGYGKVDIEASALGVNVDAKSEAFALGAGGQYFFDGANGVRAEYTRFDLEDDGGEADSLSVSYVRRF